MKNILKVRIPTLLGLFFLFFSLGATTFLTQKTTVFQGNAAVDESPQDIRITNVSHSAFTVSYRTSASVPGRLSYGSSTSLGSIALDDRDKNTPTVPSHIVHYFTITNLKASSVYYFSILSG
jgi:hypothetical protein